MITYCLLQQHLVDSHSKEAADLATAAAILLSRHHHKNCS